MSSGRIEVQWCSGGRCTVPADGRLSSRLSPCDMHFTASEPRDHSPVLYQQHEPQHQRMPTLAQRKHSPTVQKKRRSTPERRRYAADRTDTTVQDLVKTAPPKKSNTQPHQLFLKPHLIQLVTTFFRNSTQKQQKPNLVFVG